MLGPDCPAGLWLCKRFQQVLRHLQNYPGILVGNFTDLVLRSRPQLVVKVMSRRMAVRTFMLPSPVDSLYVPCVRSDGEIFGHWLML
jgi:hypothetical protein